MIIKCKNWQPSDEFFRGKCSAGKYSGRPTFGHCVDLCQQCENSRPEMDEYIQSLKRMPSKKHQVKNAAKSLIRNVSSGFRFVSLLARDERFRICNKCPYLKHRLLLRCSKCGCSLKLKTRLESESCPINKW